MPSLGVRIAGDVGADAEERRLADRHLPGVADGQVEPERRHQVDAQQRQQVDVAALQERREHAAATSTATEQQRDLQSSAHTLRSSALPSRPSGRNRITTRNSMSATPSLYAGET